MFGIVERLVLEVRNLSQYWISESRILREQLETSVRMLKSVSIKQEIWPSRVYRKLVKKLTQSWIPINLGSCISSSSTRASAFRDTSPTLMTSSSLARLAGPASTCLPTISAKFSHATPTENLGVSPRVRLARRFADMPVGCFESLEATPTLGWLQIMAVPLAADSGHVRLDGEGSHF